MANERVPIQKGREIPDEVTVVVGGQSFDGWEDVSITKNLESIANSFSLTLFDKFEGLRENWPMRPGVEIQININKERVITGRIEKANPAFTKDSRSFTISGRSFPGDLVDCMHTGPAEYLNITLKKLAEELVKPFGLRVFESIIADTISKFVVKPGETVFEALDRAARAQGLFFISTRNGNIRLTRAGATEQRFRAFSSIEQNVNLLSASADYDESKRHNDYIVKGQGAGLPTFNGLKASQPEGTAKDLGIKRHRPLILIAESNTDSAKAKTRAEWEASVRLAQSVRVSATVQGWTQGNRTLWGINQIVKFRSRILGLNRDLLIVSVEHTDGATEGKETKMTLTDAKAYVPESEKNKKETDDIFASLGANFK